MKSISKNTNRFGLVLIELLVVVSIIGFMTAMATMSLGGIFARKQFEKEAYAIIDVMKKAQHAAAQSDRRYAVVFDFIENAYILRQFATLDLESIPEDKAILSQTRFTNNCRIDYVLFDDFMDTREEGDSIDQARFYAGKSGWQHGGKIVLMDVDGNPYSIVVNRLCGKITLEPGDVDILVPLTRDELRF